MKLSPPLAHPPLKKRFLPWTSRFSFFSKKGKTFRWIFMCALGACLVIALIFFLEQAVEPRMGINLWAEDSITPDSTVPEILEKTAFTSKEPVEEKTSAPVEEQKADIWNAVADGEAAGNLPSPLLQSEIIVLQERLKQVEESLVLLLKQEESQRKLGLMFVLLRQNIGQGLPFDGLLHRLESLLSLEDPMRERVHPLMPLARQGVWPLKKIVSQFSENYVLRTQEKTGFWQNFLGFFKKLWTVRRADEPLPTQDQELSGVETDLYRGNVEEALVKLSPFTRASTPEAQEWFRQAQQFVKIQKFLGVFEDRLFDVSPLQGSQG